MKVLFVCTANVCRSPLAEGYLKHLLRVVSPQLLEVSSAGLAALPGASAFDCAIEVARLHDFDLTKHRARQLTAFMLDETDNVLFMESWQAAKVMDLDPKFSHKVGLLGSYHPQQNRLLQIPDPRQFDVTETSRTFQFIKNAVENYLTTLKTSSAFS